MSIKTETKRLFRSQQFEKEKAMQDKDYLNAGRCPGCGKMLEELPGDMFYCHNCELAWQLLPGHVEHVWCPVTGYTPPTDKEIFDNFDKII